VIPFGGKHETESGHLDSPGSRDRAATADPQTPAARAPARPDDLPAAAYAAAACAWTSPRLSASSSMTRKRTRPEPTSVERAKPQPRVTPADRNLPHAWKRTAPRRDRRGVPHPAGKPEVSRGRRRAHAARPSRQRGLIRPVLPQPLRERHSQPPATARCCRRYLRPVSAGIPRRLSRSR
jgi:hypothetical protein